MRRALGLGLPAALIVLLAALPYITIDVPIVFSGPLDSPGTLQLLALCLVFAGVALTYDLLFGFTGLMSFGHALFFGIGVYVPAIAMTKWDGGWRVGCALTAAVAASPARPRSGLAAVAGIAFAMVTLAFAQAGNVLALKNYRG